MTEIKLLLFFFAFVMVSCGGESEKKEDDAGSVSIKGAKLLCLKDKEANKFYFGGKTEDGRFFHGDTAYDTKEECEKVIAEGSKYVNK